MEPSLLAPIDPLALASLLTLGYPLGDLTLHGRIRRLPSGLRLSCPPTGPRIERSRRIAMPPLESGLRLTEAADRLGAAIEAAVAERWQPAPTPLLGLSGGFDSRVLLGAARRLGLRPESVTFGAPEHSEVQVAREVARRADVPNTLLPIRPDNVRRHLALNVSAIECTGRAMFTVTPLRQAAVEPKRPLLHGFLGDTLGGANLTKWRGVMETGLDFPAALMGPAAGGAIPADWVMHGLDAGQRASLRTAIANGLAACGDDHRAYLCWDLENRQRRLIAHHFSLLGDVFGMLLPFHAPAVREVCLSFPEALLRGRAVTRTLLRRRYSALARVRHDEERWPLASSLSGTVHALTALMVERVPALRWRFPAGPSIWDAPGREVRANRPEFENRLEAHHADYRALNPAAPRLDPDRIATLPAGSLLQFVVLAEYAAACRKAHSEGLAARRVGAVPADSVWILRRRFR